MGFKLGNEDREFKSSKNTPIFKKKLGKGILAEANNDGSIFVDHSVDLNSKKGKGVVAHEMQHMKDMKSGKSSYGEDWVRWEGTTYPRKGGKIKYKGTWSLEGSDVFPWEKVAKNAENNNK